MLHARALVLAIAVLGCGSTSKPGGGPPSNTAAPDAGRKEEGSRDSDFDCGIPPAELGKSTLAGTVRDRSGAELPGVTIVMTPKSGKPYVTISDEKGHYELTGMPQTVYKVIAYYGEHTVVRTCVMTMAGRTMALDLEIPEK